MRKLNLPTDIQLQLEEMKELLSGVDMGGSGELNEVNSCGHNCMISCSWWCERTCAECCISSTDSQNACSYKYVKTPNIKVTD